MALPLSLQARGFVPEQKISKSGQKTLDYKNRDDISRLQQATT